MSALSTAANISGLVGLADVVFRATTQICLLIKQASSAPASAAELVAVMQSLAAVIVEIRVWTVEYGRSRFAQEDGQSASDGIKNTLAACEGGLCELDRQLRGVFRRKKNGWIERLKGGVGFALSEAQIRHSVQMVVHYQMALKGLLLVHAGRDAIVLRNQMNDIRKGLQSVTAAVKSIDSTSDSVQAVCLTIQASVQTLELDRRALAEVQMTAGKSENQKQSSFQNADVFQSDGERSIVLASVHDERSTCHNQRISGIQKHDQHVFKRRAQSGLKQPTCFAQWHKSYETKQTGWQSLQSLPNNYYDTVVLYLELLYLRKHSSS